MKRWMWECTMSDRLLHMLVLLCVSTTAICRAQAQVVNSVDSGSGWTNLNDGFYSAGVAGLSPRAGTQFWTAFVAGSNIRGLHQEFSSNYALDTTYTATFAVGDRDDRPFSPVVTAYFYADTDNDGYTFGDVISTSGSRVLTGNTPADGDWETWTLETTITAATVTNDGDPVTAADKIGFVFFFNPGAGEPSSNAAFDDFRIATASDTTLLEPAALGLSSSGNLGQFTNHPLAGLHCTSGGEVAYDHGEQILYVDSLGESGWIEAPEQLALVFRNRTDVRTITLHDFGPEDGEVVIHGLRGLTGATLSNGSATLEPDALVLQATSHVATASVHLTGANRVIRTVISGGTSSNGVALKSVEIAPGRESLYRELWPNDGDGSVGIETAGWRDANLAHSISASPPGPTETTTAAEITPDPADGAKGASLTAERVTLTATGGDLYYHSGNQYFGVAGSFQDTTVSGDERITIDFDATVSVTAIEIGQYGVNDNTVTFEGFPSDPDANLSNGTVAYDAGSGTLTCTATSFAGVAALSFSSTVALDQLVMGNQNAQSTAGGTSFKSISYQTVDTAFDQSVAISGVYDETSFPILLEDYAVFSLTPGGGSNQVRAGAIVTDGDRVDFLLEDFTALDVSWRQTENGTSTAAGQLTPLVRIGSQWYRMEGTRTTQTDPLGLGWDQVTLSTATPFSLTPVDLGSNGVATTGGTTDLSSGQVSACGFVLENLAADDPVQFHLDDIRFWGDLVALDRDQPWRFVSQPDLVNSDPADLRGSPDYDGSNNLFEDLEERFAFNLDALASENPDFLLVAGDIVEGEWLWKSAFEAEIGAWSNLASAIPALHKGGEFVYGQYASRAARRDLPMIGCIGDHEMGDNDWPVNDIKSQLANEFRGAFSTHFTRDDAGRLLYPLRPQSGDFAQTSFGLRWRDALFLSIDVFFQQDPGVSIHPATKTIRADMDATHLAWVDETLANRAGDSDIQLAVAMAHTPILAPVLKQSSSGMLYWKRDASDLWQTFANRDLDFYFAGEVHNVTPTTQDGIQHIVHGKPVSEYPNYLTVEIEGTSTVARLTTDQDWANGIADSLAVSGELFMDLSGPGHTVTSRSGDLLAMDRRGLIVHWPLDETSGLSIANEGIFQSYLDAYDGVLSAGTATFSAGKLGNGINLTGSESFDNNDGHFPTSWGEPRTFAFWFKTASASEQELFYIGFNSDKFAARAQGSTLTVRAENVDIPLTAPGSLSDDAWHHVAITAPLVLTGNNNIQNLRFFIDGTEVTPGTPPQSKNLVTPGGGSVAFGTGFTGSFDDIGLWGRELSAIQIKVLHEVAGIGYDAGEAEALLQAFTNQRSAQIQGDRWGYRAGGLTGIEGALQGNPKEYTIVFDSGSGAGMVTRVQGTVFVFR
jgi:hypothetical protein